MSESAFLTLLRAIATDPAARGLVDDAAVLEVGGARLVLTQDSIVEGVHFLSDDPPADIGWKLAAVNLSDLAAKGARPIACLMSYALSGDDGWDSAFLDGLRMALNAYAMPLIGGDTVAMPRGSARSFTLTAIGEAGTGPVPSRAGANAGDLLCVTGPVGAAGAGLDGLVKGMPVAQILIDAYRRPLPQIAEGSRLAPLVTAMMDISDGLLIDARRMADASDVGVVIEHIPVADALGLDPGDIAALLRAATAGDDYVLLLALPADVVDPRLIRIGRFEPGAGLRLVIDGKPVPLPASLGYSHETGGRVTAL